MPKKQIALRLDQETLDKLNAISAETGRTRTSLIQKAIEQSSSDDKHDHQQIELLNKRNEQLQIVLSATQAIINEKDRKYDDMMQAKNDMIKTKNDIIKAKDDLIAGLKHRKRGFWAKLFGK